MVRQTLGKINVSISIDANLWWQLEDMRNALSMHAVPNRSIFYEALLRKGLAYERLLKSQEDEGKEEEFREEVRKYVQEMKQVKEEE